ncbi:unnamed protein product [Cylindrotheca closterium]|uniref:protein-tyrosine-phosphatase n=1 Tax=Cylindrotheca closterium TaxID=2856 RepID=A0AAD2FMW0_9STRA|nr:unnamed protein product [Cylindrotheca closterium]
MTSKLSSPNKRMKRTRPLLFGIKENELNSRLKLIRKLVAKPMPIDPETKMLNDPTPASISSILIGNKYHCCNVDWLVENGVTAVLNCASGGISNLPLDTLVEKGIEYQFTNVRRDDVDYPLLHSLSDGVCSQHLEIAKKLYAKTLEANGKLLLFCVAGQNRSATLGLAVLLLYGHPLEDILQSCAEQRSFVMENEGFQRQLVELEHLLKTTKKIKGVYSHADAKYNSEKQSRRKSQLTKAENMVEVELLIPGHCSMDVMIPEVSTIAAVKQCLVDEANKNLLNDEGRVVAKSWVVLAGFGHDPMYDFPLETAAIDLQVQLDRMKAMFRLEIVSTPPPTDASKDNTPTKGNDLESPRKTPEVIRIRWTSKCRFALVIFSASYEKDGQTFEEPWTFEHKERSSSKSSLLQNNLINTDLRAWDFETGQAFASCDPIVFSFADDPRDRRSFMKISTQANAPQQFRAPGEGGILGMGANAVVHHVELDPTSPLLTPRDWEKSDGLSWMDALPQHWNAAVKRPFGLSKMLASMKSSSEAGLAKRVRFANRLNKDGRVLRFYGLGVALSANADKPSQYKFEVAILSRYEEEFSTYTMRKFLEDYSSNRVTCPKVIKWRKKFSLISVKVLLVSLLNAFRDLTLVGVRAFDFNHLNNVLVSRDHQTVKLLDIDGMSKGIIEFDSDYINGDDDDGGGCSGRTNTTTSKTTGGSPRKSVHKPALDVDLNTILPNIVYELLLGKARPPGFVSNKKSEIWRAPKEKAKELIKEVIRENFFHDSSSMALEEPDAIEQEEKHLGRLSEWFWTMMKKQEPWGNWTKDIYDAMRCIDHLPIA